MLLCVPGSKGQPFVAVWPSRLCQDMVGTCARVTNQVLIVYSLGAVPHSPCGSQQWSTLSIQLHFFLQQLGVLALIVLLKAMSHQKPWATVSDSMQQRKCRHSLPFSVSCFCFFNLSVPFYFPVRSHAIARIYFSLLSFFKLLFGFRISEQLRCCTLPFHNLPHLVWYI